VLCLISRVASWGNSHTTVQVGGVLRDSLSNLRGGRCVVPYFQGCPVGQFSHHGPGRWGFEGFSIYPAWGWGVVPYFQGWPKLIYCLCMTVYLKKSLPKSPYMNRMYMVLANPTNFCTLCPSNSSARTTSHLAKNCEWLFVVFRLSGWMQLNVGWSCVCVCVCVCVCSLSLVNTGTVSVVLVWLFAVFD
jgi:hypothetical protein